jgi:hypothetical protein
MSTPASVDLLEEHPRALFEAVSAVFRGWLRERAVCITGAAGRTLTATEEKNLDAVIESAVDRGRDALCALLATDVDEQRSNPLQVLRSATLPVTEFLTSLGVPAAKRDEFESRAMPDDVFAFGPLAWVDMGEDVHERGITWGAWKAATVLTRRRGEGVVCDTGDSVG